ncbi:MAG: LysR family transcriptional regulator [Burkholderiales bacterium]|nr:LysR family transcriptional regulator [Burkholderiales bacterium]
MRHDLISLKLFVAVAECGNLTRAAEREHLAVSAVSKRIAELEDLVRTPLLQRYPRGVGLTPAGQAMLHHARLVLQGVDHLESELAGFADGVRGHVRLHAVASALYLSLPEEIDSFLTTYPGVRVSLEEHTGKAVVLAVAAGAADLGVIAAQTPSPGLVNLPYRSDRLAIGVPLNHPLARRESARFAEALDYAFVGPHAESSIAQLMIEGARACGKTLEQRVQASSFDAMCRLVQTRLGITVLPQSVLVPHAQAGRIRMLHLDEDWAARRMVIVVRDPHAVGHIAQSLIEHMQRMAVDSGGAGNDDLRS